MSYEDQMPEPAAPNAEKYNNDSCSGPEEDAPASQKRIRLYHQLKETPAKLTPNQYLLVLMTAVNCGLLNNDEYQSFGDLAAIDNEEVFSSLAHRLPEYLLEKLERIFTTVEEVKKGVAGDVEAATENV